MQFIILIQHFYGEYVVEEYHDFELEPLELDPEDLKRPYEPKAGQFTENYQTLGRFGHARNDLFFDWKEQLANQKSVTARFLLKILQSSSYYNTLGKSHNFYLTNANINCE